MKTPDRPATGSACGPSSVGPWRNRTVLFLLLLLGVKTGLFIAAGQPPLVADPFQYWCDGQRIAQGDWCLVGGQPQITRTPGYALFLAALDRVFGSGALIAATAGQQIMVFGSAILAAWMCGRLTGSKAGVVAGLALSLACCSRNSVAVYLYSDTLLGLLLTLWAVFFLLWFERPTWLRAAAVGLILGAAVLVKPVAELAWVPTLLGMALRLRQLGLLRFAPVQFAALMAVFLAAVGPWLVRNQVYFGHPFLTKFAGRNLWWSCFRGNVDDPINPSIPFGEDPTTVTTLAGLRDRDPHNAWLVYGILVYQGRSAIEADDLMLHVAWEAVKAHPRQFLFSRCVRFAWFWVTPNGTFRPKTAELRSQGYQADESGQQPGKPMPEGCASPSTWRSEWYFDRGRLNVLWYPHPVPYGLAALAAAAGLAVMARDPRQRILGITFGLWGLYFCAVVTIVGSPEYRYRMVLEPLMIVVVVTACVSVLQARSRKRRVQNDGT